MASAAAVPALAEGCVRRAAFDVGSGAHKMDVADVHLGSNRVVRTWHTEQRSVLMAQDLIKGGTGSLSPAILATSRRHLTEFKAIAVALGATAFRGVGTAVFRRADNGLQYLASLAAELDIHVQLISQELEGKIGFLTAAAQRKEGETGPIVAWDSGGASFQITVEQVADDGGRSYRVYEGPTGSSVVVGEMVTAVQGKDFIATQSANPATVEEARALATAVRKSIGDVPAWVSEAVQAEGCIVVGIGGTTSMFRLLSLVTGRDTLSKDDAWAVATRLCGQTDAELSEYPECEMAVCKAVLGAVVMELLAMPPFHYRPTNGGCPGILLSPEIWARAAP